MNNVRNAVRALIVNDDKLLVIKMRDGSGDFYLLPGGGQQRGETLTDALQRECLEEIGCSVNIGELLYLREYIGKNHTFSFRHKEFHQLEAVFRCELDDPAAACVGCEKDKRQVDIAWIPLGELEESRFYPEAIKQYFSNGSFELKPAYLGDVN